MSTIILSKNDVVNLLDKDILYEQIKESFVYYSKREDDVVGKRVRSSLLDDNSSAMVLFPGFLQHIPAFTIKNHAKFPFSDPSIKCENRL